jgi:hypothetical protein
MTEIDKALRQKPVCWSQASADAEAVDYTDSRIEIRLFLLLLRLAGGYTFRE